jgi:hypothetical protein
MNHCVDCGRRINAGLTCHRSDENVHCLICIQARVLRTWRYVSPAMKRWRRKQGKAQS